MRIGIDLGGSKIEAIALAGDGEVLWRQRLATPKGDYDGIVASIVGLVARLETDLDQRGSVGIGTPGRSSAIDGLMKNCNSTILNGRPFAADLARALGRDIRIANDADCFTLSESRDGAAVNAASVFGVILGTGVGGAVVVEKRLLAGANGICGEWGHNPTVIDRRHEYRPRHCYCGRVDCVETWLSGPGFETSYFDRTGVRLPAINIAQQLARGEPGASACYRAYVEMLARALATVINIIDPYVVVLGGGMSNIEPLCDDVMKCWAQHIFSDQVDTRLVKARHGDSSGVRGAAWLWPES